MPNKTRGLARSRLLWIITCYRNNRMEVLTIDPDGHGGSLPVFSFEEEAQTYLCLSEEDDQERMRRWRTREATAGELVSILLAPCAEVRQVMLDPLPLSLGMVTPPFLSIARKRFIEDLLMRDRRELAGELLVPA